MGAVLICGIAASIAWGEPKLIQQVQAICDLQQCRGPDDRGILETAISPEVTALLGHTRLSIIDLSASGHQPMSAPNEEISITYNGEIYNYRELRSSLEGEGWTFRGESDSEVLLAAYCIWGLESFHRFNGMFAVAILDQSRNNLHLVRSRFGAKPLHYAATPNGYLVASTPDALARVIGARPNMQYLARGFSTWSYDGSESETAFEGVTAVLPGMRVTFDLSGSIPPKPHSEQWYDLRAHVGQVDVPHDDVAASALVRELVDDSVRLRLRSDVPVGISLSGGLDSTILALTAAEQIGDRTIQAFSYRNHPQDPEIANINAFLATAGGRNVNINWVVPPARADIESIVLQALDDQGSPFGGPSILAQGMVFAAAETHGVKVMLGGQGADELFLGYRKYQAVAAIEACRNRELGNATRLSTQLARTLWADRNAARSYFHAARRYVGRTSEHSLMRSSAVASNAPVPRTVEELQLADIAWQGFPTLLRYEDRNSMAHSIESRLPFLDYRIVETALSFERSLKLRNGYGKWVLRNAYSSLLPREIAWARYKFGFAADSQVWIDCGVGPVLRTIVGDNVRGLQQLGVQITPHDVNKRYSDHRLLAHPSRLHEALQLSWLTRWI